MISKNLHMDANSNRSLDILYLIIAYYNYNDNTDSFANLQYLLHSKFEECVKIVLVEGVLEGKIPLCNLPKSVHKHMVFNLPDKIWAQSNLINLALRNLDGWEYATWTDKDVIFTDPFWSSKVIQKLKSGVDILQPFSECVFLNQKMQPCPEETSIFFPFAEQGDSDFKIISYMKSIKDNIKCDKKTLYRHPGQAWAISKSFFQKIDGIFDKGILGGNDMMTCQMIDPKQSLTNYYSLIFKQDYFFKKFKFGRPNFDYLDGLIMHRTHGDTSKRKYFSRYDILKNDRSFDSTLDVGYTNDGVVRLTDRGRRFLPYMESYFSSRGD